VPTASKKLGSYKTSGTREIKIIYTVPVGYRTIVKEIAIYSESATAALLVQVWARDATTQHSIWLVREDLAPSTPFQHSSWMVLEAGDELHVAAAGPDCDFWISGSQLTIQT